MIAVIFRTLILYVFVIVGIRLMGKRQIGDMQPSELVITLLISEIAAIPLQDTTQPIASGIVAIFTLVILEIAVSIIAMKSFFARKLLSGKSAVVIKNGEIDQHAMRRIRLTVIDLIELLRSQNVFDISTVAFAVIEVNGDLSVLLKSENLPVTAGDLNIKSEPDGLPLPVICDGKIVNETLTSLEIDRKKILKCLKKEKLRESDVFLMTMDRYGNTNTVKKREGRKK
ncbi:MAG: DUF421 domain-containing protein [Ruminococcaceae bacterium]|nr:DUF421 domain-containing protein [Oscillospiraceae bacterium]